MTLLIAQTDGTVAWMVADTAISNSLRDTRTREFRLKVVPGQGMSLLGYADNADRGAATVREAMSLRPGCEVLKVLTEVHMTYRDVEFAYAFIEDGTAKLFKIADGVAEQVQTLYLGDSSAYEAFQAIRHSEEIDHAPDSIHMFFAWLSDQMSDERSNSIIPRLLISSIVAMQKLFVRSSDRGVGGVAIPFVISDRGPELLNYAYSVTDPITRELAFGSVIPHGTAEQGGYGVVVSQLAEKDGIVVYWPQRPGGTIHLRSKDRDDIYFFDGGPSEFIKAVKCKLGRDVSIFFGDGASGTNEPHSLRMIFDEKGLPCQAISSSDTEFSFSWLNTSEESFKMPFAELPIGIGTEFAEPPDGLQGTVTGDGERLKFSANDPNGLSVETSITAQQVDQLIRHLAQLRGQMKDKVSSDPEGGVYPVSLNPTWRTFANVHPAFPGTCLSLRHEGLGWLMYWLPQHEAKALGEWIVTHGSNVSEK